MNGGPSDPLYRPDLLGGGEPIQHDAPTEMFTPAAFTDPHVQAAAGHHPPLTQPRPTVRPEQLIRPQNNQALPPGGPHVKLAALWKRDPAYKVLFVAIGVILLSSIVGVALLGNAFMHGSSSPQQQADIPTTTTTPTGTATPATGQAAGAQATATIQATAMPTPTPTPQVTPTPVPSPTPQPSPTANPNTPLSVQITSIPTTVNNHTTVSVSVSSIPGATVWLTITTNANPPYITTAEQPTDGNGNAVIAWQINDKAYIGFIRTATASVVAVARGANGQQLNSQPQTVKIHLGG
ncbi:hypothetical protein [Dictyobacter arantiisoli]|uniref:Uncharacterized protein n=1 Tax=Dictyobacter arantiisoli TaxID=2014874 RepID=A0A5A5T925_9CHLR|nr:hypothetical protein [Dictyobacter arantiisoli]GCF07499.1 hypothetical protein KDI_10630 [Dictyobacter arantiisoli]